MRHVRTALDWLYVASGAMAGAFLVVILILVLAQIATRLFGAVVPSADEFAGFSMMASTFLALAYTFRHGGHVRVSLLVTNLHGRKRTAAEVVALCATIAVIAYFFSFTIDLAWQSYVFKDVSIGLLPIPLWIPQTGMATGVGILLVALIDDLVAILRGRDPQYMRSEIAGKTAAQADTLEANRQARKAKAD